MAAVEQEVQVSADAKSQAMSRKERRQLKQQSKAQELLPLQQKLQSQDEDEQFEGVRELRELLTSAGAPATEVLLCTEIVPALLQLCRDEERRNIQFEALMTLSDLTEGASHDMGELLETGVLDSLAGPVASQESKIREVSITVLTAAAQASPESCSSVMDCEATLSVLRMLVARDVDQPAPVLHKGAALLGCLCSGGQLFEERTPEAENMTLLVQALAELVMNNDEEVLVPTCSALSKLHYGRLQLAVLWKQGVCQRMVFLFTHPTIAISTGACIAARKIGEGTTVGMQALMLSEPIKPLKEMLESDEVDIQRESCLTLACILKFGGPHVQEVIDAGCTPLLTGLQESSSINVKDAATEALGYLSS